MSTIVYGPHCHHDECGWHACNHTGLVDFPCHQQVNCPYCGPGSEQWPHIAHGMAEWLTKCYGTIEPKLLREANAVESAVRYADLLADHPPTSTLELEQ